MTESKAKNHDVSAQEWFYGFTKKAFLRHGTVMPEKCSLKLSKKM